MKLILLGAPGAGKGTQAEILGRMCGIPTISTGNILRAAVKNGTKTGLQAKEYMDAGKLVPDEVIIGIIRERLAQDDCSGGYILDGVPRTVRQAQVIEDEGIEIDCVLALEVGDEEIIQRMSGRRVCSSCGASFHVSTRPPKAEGRCDECGGELIVRSDDAPETVKARLAQYHAETEPLKDFYAKRGKLKPVEGCSTIEETTAAIVKILGL